MEVYVAVGSTEQDQIPKVFGAEEKVYFMCFMVDSEDKTIYRRTSVKTTSKDFVEVAISNKIDAFVYDTMDEKFEKGLEKANIKLFPGRTGASPTAAVSIFDK